MAGRQDFYTLRSLPQSEVTTGKPLSVFYGFWYFLAGLLVVITCINGYFVLRVSKQYPELYERLGKPTPFFFATGGWLTSGKFTRYLLSRQPTASLSSDPTLRLMARVLAVLYLVMLFTILGAVASVFFRW